MSLRQLSLAPIFFSLALAASAATDSRLRPFVKAIGPHPVVQANLARIIRNVSAGREPILASKRHRIYHDAAMNLMAHRHQILGDPEMSGYLKKELAAQLVNMTLSDGLMAQLESLRLNDASLDSLEAELRRVFDRGGRLSEEMKSASARTEAGAAVVLPADYKPQAPQSLAPFSPVHAEGGGDPLLGNMGWAELKPVPAEAPDSVARMPLDIDPAVRYMASPADWRDEIFYSVIVDRFARADPALRWGDPADPRTRHGGNIRGLTEKLDYLQQLGVTTILVNPIVMNPPAGYHQYWPIHFGAVDPHLGSMADFKSFVSQAHKKGIRVVLDLVLNHSGPVIEYEGDYKFGPAKKIKRWVYPLKPAELAQPENFERRGSIGDWDHPGPGEFEHGDLPGGMNKFTTENPATRDLLVHITKWWIKETDIDGLRLDAFKHIGRPFWDRFSLEIRGHAASMGKNNFLLAGEIYDGNPQSLVSWMEKGALDSAYNYPAYFWNYAALHGDAPTLFLQKSFEALQSTLGDALKSLLSFLDNPDKPRFLRPNDPAGILRFAVAYTLMSIGIPYIYYATEQAFRQVQGREAFGMDAYREDMFPGGQFTNPGARADSFDNQSATYQLISSLSAIRRKHPSLSRGDQYIRWSDHHGPGIFAFSRIYKGKETLVVLNSAPVSRSAEMWIDNTINRAGAVLQDEMDPVYESQVVPSAGGVKVSVEVPPYGIRILVAKSKAGNGN